MSKTDTSSREDSTTQAAEKVSGRAGQVRSLRAERAQNFPGEIPGGQLRTRTFPGKMQTRLVERDGKQFYHVEGFATVFERAYEMWDMFGSYKETMDIKSLNKSLGNDPDTAFLVNHRGVTMARTTNGTLELKKGKDEEGYTGLHIDAYLNPNRQDVRDFVLAVEDKLIDEMSFAFMLNDGEWNEEYDEFRITEADINRGDVSGVNYGANPFTSIQARTADILADLEYIPPSALGRAQRIVARRVFSSAAINLSERSAERYRRAAEQLERAASLGSSSDDSVVNDLANIREWAIVDETGDVDPDDNAAALAKAVDASLDTAVALLANVDASTLPPEVQQAIDLINGAEANIDELLEVMGLADPDDADSEELSQTVDSVRDKFNSLESQDEQSDSNPEIKHVRGGKPIYLHKLWLEEAKKK